MLGEDAAEREFAGGGGHGLLAVGAEDGEDFGDEGGVVLRDDAEGVAGGVGEGGAGGGEIELDVVDLLGGAGGVEGADGAERGGERVVFGVTCFCWAPNAARAAWSQDSKGAS